MPATEIKFINIWILNLNLDSLNSIIFQYTQYYSQIKIMLGPQAGIVIKNKQDINYYRDLFEHYTNKLESLMSLYNIEAPDFITIHIK